MTTALLPDLHDLVRSVAAKPSLWQPHMRFNEGSRYWHRLASLPGADLWLLTWMPDQYTDLHDHGTAVAAFTVVQGELEEVRVLPGDVLHRSAVAPGTVRTVPAGAVHDVRNVGIVPAVSIHAYSPHLQAMTFWESTPGGLRPVRTVATDEPEIA